MKEAIIDEKTLEMFMRKAVQEAKLREKEKKEFEKGFREGFKEGKQKVLKKVAQKMKMEGFDVAIIEKITGLSQADIESL